MNVYLCVTMLSEHDAIIPHFVRHYLKLGVEPERFIVTLNVPSRGSNALRRASEILAEFGIAPAYIYFGGYEIAEDHQQTMRLIKALTTPDDWMICCDLDEFQEYPTPQVSPFLRSCAESGFNFVRGTLVDRTAASGELPAITATPTLWEQFPIESDLSHRLGAAETSKVLAHRCALEPVPGHHSIRPRENLPAHPYPERLRVHHFKWDASAPERFDFAIRKQGNPFWAATSAHFLNHIREWKGINLAAIPPAHSMQPLQIPEGEISFEIEFSQAPPDPWRVGQRWQTEVLIHNYSGFLLVSQDPAPIFFAYHWLTLDGAMICRDGERSALLPPLPARSLQRYSVAIETPEEAGLFLLQPALVQERVRWLESVTKVNSIHSEIFAAE